MRPQINVGFAQDSRKYFVSFAKNGRLQIKEFRSTAIDFPAMADDTPISFQIEVVPVRSRILPERWKERA